MRQIAGYKHSPDSSSSSWRGPHADRDRYGGTQRQRYVTPLLLTPANTPSNHPKASFLSSPTSACEKEDEADCKEFCELSDQTSTCIAAGNKITCSCKGGKKESNCEERCLLCKSHALSLSLCTGPLCLTRTTL